jgi:hypothetical protein
MTTAATGFVPRSYDADDSQLSEMKSEDDLRESELTGSSPSSVGADNAESRFVLSVSVEITVGDVLLAIDRHLRPGTPSRRGDGCMTVVQMNRSGRSAD